MTNHNKKYDPREFEDSAEDNEEFTKIHEDPAQRTRMTALQALNHPFITGISEKLIEELLDSTTDDGKHLSAIAQDSLNQLKHYKPHMCDKLGNNIGKELEK